MFRLVNLDEENIEQAAELVNTICPDIAVLVHYGSIVRL